MMSKDVKLYNIIDKNDERRFIIVKGGCYYALTYENIEQLKELFSLIETDEAKLFEEVKKARRGLD